MPTTAFERSIERLTKRANKVFGEDVVRLRTDAGITRRELGRAAGVNDSYLARIEAGTAQPSTETCVRLGVVLGADLGHRLYPNTGPTIRDRHQAAIEQALLSIVHPRWRPYPEVAVWRPARGWIDVGFHAAGEGAFLATEIESGIGRLEQTIRWAEAKAESVPSWQGFAQLGGPCVISRLLIVRETRANRAVARDFGRVLRAAYPAHPLEALEALTGTPRWPGSALLWAARTEPPNAGYRIVARL